MSVFSTYVEVILLLSIFNKLSCSILHVCGGDPEEFITFDQLKRVFSTYVEVILQDVAGGYAKTSILHVCGGDPEYSLGRIVIFPYSPRMWR